MKGSAGSLDLLQNVAGRGSPDEGLRAFVVTVGVLVDGRDQLLDVAEDAPAEPVVGQIPEEALHHVEPGGTGRSEVDVKSRMARQPALHSGMLVGGVVVGNQVDLFLRRRGVVNQRQEPLPRAWSAYGPCRLLLCPMLGFPRPVPAERT